MMSLEQLRENLADQRRMAETYSKALKEIDGELQEYWSQRQEYRDAVYDTLRTRVDDCNKVQLLGYRGEKTKQPSAVWVGTANGGHVEPTSKEVIQVFGRKFRSQQHRTWDEIHAEFLPLLRERATVKADLDAALRWIDHVSRAIEIRNKQFPPRRQKRPRDTVNGQGELWS